MLFIGMKFLIALTYENQIPYLIYKSWKND